jgi:SAM-dependent methyltransferase
MQQTGTRALSARELLDVNRLYYDSLWSGAQLVEPGRFNTWPLIQALLPRGGERLEVAPGLRPRLPLEGTQFVDVSAPALAKLARRGASVVGALITSLPFADASFDLVCALDIVEHVDDDAAALEELSRVARPGAAVLLSVPLHPELWNAFDDFVGHRRRYRPESLTEILGGHGLAIERSAVYGMQPRSSRLLDLGMWFLTHERERALWWYNRVFMPLGLMFQKKLTFGPGLIAAGHVDEILMICRKVPRGAVSGY